LSFALGVAGCAASATAQEYGDTGLDRLRAVVAASPVALPAVRLDIDEEGRVAKVNGFDAADIDAMWERVNGTPLFGRIRFFASDDGGRSYVEWFREAGIQHITVTTRDDGLYVLVNGSPLPHLAWDAERLENLLTALRRLEADGGPGMSLFGAEQLTAISDALPLVQGLNLRVDLRFPLPTDDEGKVLVERVPLPADGIFRQVARETAPPRPPLQTVDMEVAYRELEDGGWIPSFFEFSTLDLQTLLEPLGYEVPLLELPEELRLRIEREGISSLGMQVADGGLFLSMDDQPLPHVAWDEESLTNLTGLLHRLYPDGDSLPDDAKWVPVVRATAPMYNDFAIAILLRFPVDPALRVNY
jgi:hypothetical protein